MEAAKISMIALDLDGTCLDSTGKMVDRTRNILEYYGEKGTQIVFTTGRPIAGILKELRTISGTNYAIALNGGMVYELLDERIIYKKSIEAGYAIPLTAFQVFLNGIKFDFPRKLQ